METLGLCSASKFRRKPVQGLLNGEGWITLPIAENLLLTHGLDVLCRLLRALSAERFNPMRQNQLEALGKLGRMSFFETHVLPGLRSPAKSSTFSGLNGNPH